MWAQPSLALGFPVPRDLGEAVATEPLSSACS